MDTTNDSNMMLAHDTYSSRHHHQPQPQPHHYYVNSTATTHDVHAGFPSTHSISTLDNIPAAAAAIAASQKYRNPRLLQHIIDGDSGTQGLNQVPELMPSNSWMLPNLQTRKGSHRPAHQRDSSLSSLNSNGPSSPFSQSTSNPQIALNDASSDVYNDGLGDTNYSYNALGKSLGIPDDFYAGGLASFGNVAGNAGSANLIGPGDNLDNQIRHGLPDLSTPKSNERPPQSERGLAPPLELSMGGESCTKSHPPSVASSVAGGDSPATPSFHDCEAESRRQQKNGTSVFSSNSGTGQIPKLDRTMTDIYNDELYNPNFTITSASPPPQTHVAMSPRNELFARTLHAANSQHLSAAQSPVSESSRGRSPFRQDSPYASTISDFSQMGVNQAPLGAGQTFSRGTRSDSDAENFHQPPPRASNQQQGTPSTISPKEALLDFNDDDGTNFPLFPPQDSSEYGLGAGLNAASSGKVISQDTTNTSFQSLAPAPMQSDFTFSMATHIPVPQQYPFVGRLPPSSSTPSATTFSRETSNSSTNDGLIKRPQRTNADGGTYTCTYHGCTLRFETPGLLQKHKREGHRQAHSMHQARTGGVSTTKAGVSGELTNSQAGPHRCDRINPSTGKPCNTIFSRPYDLTRHEDTIHNARKHKVRCDLCTEEKTFSRADALTRHYRVCHPDVEFPGKIRRRGGVEGG